MLKKKISREDWAYINKYNYAAKWLRQFCSYTLIKEPDGRFKREQRIGWPMYLLTFIPAHLLMLLCCLWDGGLKEFEIVERYIGGNWMVDGSDDFTRAEEIWNNNF